jgi:hypothetical protein
MFVPAWLSPAPKWPAHFVSRIGPRLASERLTDGAMPKNRAKKRFVSNIWMRGWQASLQMLEQSSAGKYRVLVKFCFLHWLRAVVDQGQPTSNISTGRKQAFPPFGRSCGAMSRRIV